MNASPARKYCADMPHPERLQPRPRAVVSRQACGGSRPAADLPRRSDSRALSVRQSVGPTPRAVPSNGEQPVASAAPDGHSSRARGCSCGGCIQVCVQPVDVRLVWWRDEHASCVGGWRGSSLSRSAWVLELEARARERGAHDWHAGCALAGATQTLPQQRGGRGRGEKTPRRGPRCTW
jgi:hypothetical protein